ncbi:hypothetical protein ACFP9V_19165 [Deinococcus radiopugnans]|uniref:Uncharacterized protein n=1 Tax=Deinococcus radiopugnans ATCC 19172 TaxID=585398 RepID=A0ABR6NV92_9DEIO|nr:hypothetical protein [Deinococcus radiopugnans]MBB6016826.1 hypothetical protein [Deinococcus radiopugnans ATCC 19172]
MAKIPPPNRKRDSGNAVAKRNAHTAKMVIQPAPDDRVREAHERIMEKHHAILATLVDD